MVRPGAREFARQEGSGRTRFKENQATVGIFDALTPVRADNVAQKAQSTAERMRGLTDRGKWEKAADVGDSFLGAVERVGSRDAQAIAHTARSLAQGVCQGNSSLQAEMMRDAISGILGGMQAGPVGIMAALGARIVHGNTGFYVNHDRLAAADGVFEQIASTSQNPAEKSLATTVHELGGAGLSDRALLVTQDEAFGAVTHGVATSPGAALAPAALSALARTNDTVTLMTPGDRERVVSTFLGRIASDDSGDAGRMAAEALHASASLPPDQAFRLQYEGLVAIDQVRLESSLGQGDAVTLAKDIADAARPSLEDGRNANLLMENTRELAEKYPQKSATQVVALAVLETGNDMSNAADRVTLEIQALRSMDSAVPNRSEQLLIQAALDAAKNGPDRISHVAARCAMNVFYDGVPAEPTAALAAYSSAVNVMLHGPLAHDLQQTIYKAIESNSVSEGEVALARVMQSMLDAKFAEGENLRVVIDKGNRTFMQGAGDKAHPALEKFLATWEYCFCGSTEACTRDNETVVQVVGTEEARYPR